MIIKVAWAMIVLSMTLAAKTPSQDACAILQPGAKGFDKCMCNIYCAMDLKKGVQSAPQQLMHLRARGCSPDMIARARDKACLHFCRGGKCQRSVCQKLCAHFDFKNRLTAVALMEGSAYKSKEIAKDLGAVEQCLLGKHKDSREVFGNVTRMKKTNPDSAKEIVTAFQKLFASLAELLDTPHLLVRSEEAFRKIAAHGDSSDFRYSDLTRFLFLSGAEEALRDLGVATPDQDMNTLLDTMSSVTTEPFEVDRTMNGFS